MTNNTEDNVTINYYSNNNISNFYKNIWGGENIHIGIYDNETDINKITIDTIKKCSDKKSELMLKLIKMYKNNTTNYTIADFGAGFGGTSRYIKSNLVYPNIIDCYDISNENCKVNILKNLENNLDIGVYNMSFLNIPVQNYYYDIIIAEDVFIHINNKNDLFKEMTRVITPSGFLILSDILLDDNYDSNNDIDYDISDVCKRIGINKIDNEYNYKMIAKQNGFVLCNSIELKDNMLTHYECIKKLTEDHLEKSEEYNRIINGLDNWIKHIKLNNITWKILIFKKYL